MVDLIVIAGAPGSGKSTICRELRKKLGSPLIEYGWIREFHLDREWKNQSSEEEQLSFENLVYILENYIRRGWKNVIVTDLRDFRVEQIPRVFAHADVLVATLIVSIEALTLRLKSREEGFRNVEEALEWNKHVQLRDLLPNEYRIVNTNGSAVRAADRIIALIEAEARA
jgi:broad-specificity NMP kinase